MNLNEAPLGVQLIRAKKVLHHPTDNTPVKVVSIAGADRGISYNSVVVPLSTIPNDLDGWELYKPEAVEFGVFLSDRYEAIGHDVWQDLEDKNHYDTENVYGFFKYSQK